MIIYLLKEAVKPEVSTQVLYFAFVNHSITSMYQLTDYTEFVASVSSETKAKIIDNLKAILGDKTYGRRGDTISLTYGEIKQLGSYFIADEDPTVPMNWTEKSSNSVVKPGERTYNVYEYRNYLYHQIHDPLQKLITENPNVEFFKQLQTKLKHELIIRADSSRIGNYDWIQTFKTIKRTTSTMIYCIELCHKLVPLFNDNINPINDEIRAFVQTSNLFRINRDFMGFLRSPSLILPMYEILNKFWFQQSKQLFISQAADSVMSFEEWKAEKHKQTAKPVEMLPLDDGFVEVPALDPANPSSMSQYTRSSATAPLLPSISQIPSIHWALLSGPAPWPTVIPHQQIPPLTPTCSSLIASFQQSESQSDLPEKRGIKRNLYAMDNNGTQPEISDESRSPLKKRIIVNTNSTSTITPLFNLYRNTMNASKTPSNQNLFDQSGALFRKWHYKQ